MAFYYFSLNHCNFLSSNVISAEQKWTAKEVKSRLRCRCCPAFIVFFSPIYSDVIPRYTAKSLLIIFLIHRWPPRDKLINWFLYFLFFLLQHRYCKISPIALIGAWSSGENNIQAEERGKHNKGNGKISSFFHFLYFYLSQLYPPRPCRIRWGFQDAMDILPVWTRKGNDDDRGEGGGECVRVKDRKFHADGVLPVR